MKLTKNTYPNKCGYSCYGIGFGARTEFSLLIDECDNNVIVFGVDNTSSSNPDNRKKDTLCLGEGPRDGLDVTTITSKAKYSVSVTKF